MIGKGKKERIREGINVEVRERGGDRKRRSGREKRNCVITERRSVSVYVYVCVCFCVCVCERERERKERASA